MKIGEIARNAGVNPQTIRFYERRGLLNRPRRMASGYRDFPFETVQRVLGIKRAQRLGFTLSEIQEMMRLEQPGLHVEQVRMVAGNKIRDIDEKIKALKSIRKSLRQLLRVSHRRETKCPVLDPDTEKS
jgi:DNA-binding transcriptional MerR regulator